MFHILSRIVSPTTPKLHFLRNHPWLHLKFISSTTSPISKGNSFTASYLIDTFGFSPERAASFSKHVNFETREKPDLVIEFLKSLGFTPNNVLRVIRRFPILLKLVPENSLKPKIDFFKSKGFSDSDVLKIVMGFPNILTRSLQNEIIPSFDHFDEMFQCKDKFMKVVMRHSSILCDLNKISAPNVKLLREEGVPESHIVKFIEYYPQTLKAGVEKFKKTVQEVKELKFNPLRMYFVVAINVKIITSRSTWERKEGIYKRWGWTDDDILAAFRACPWCFSVSDDKIEGVMDFLVKEMGYKASAIARYPIVFTMSLEKRIIPRGSVFRVLLSKGLVKQLGLAAIFKWNEKVFLDKFVSCHKKEAAELLKLYQAKMAVPADHRQVCFKPSSQVMNEMKQ